jgi:predicted RNase H-like HicB family nuclease
LRSYSRSWRAIFVRKEPPMLTIEVEQEADGRWIAEVTALPGVLAYGATEAEARARAATLACRVIADLIEHGEPIPDAAHGLFAPA